MALHWPVLTATQVWTNNGNGDTSTGSVRDPQRHQWIKADWLHMTPFCCFSFCFFCSFMILCLSIYNHIYMHVFIYYIYLVMFILFLLFRSSQAVLQNQEICESSGFWKDTLEVVQIIWPVHFWPQVISESRSSFWLQAQGRWGQGLWCILVSPIQTLSSRYKTLRMQDNSRTKAWEKERKKCCVYYSHIGAHNMLQPLMIPWTNTTLFIGPVKWTYILAFTNNFQPHIKSNHTLFSIL